MLTSGKILATPLFADRLSRLKIAKNRKTGKHASRRIRGGAPSIAEPHIRPSHKHGHLVFTPTLFRPEKNLV